MEEEKRLQMRELLRTHQSRLRVLELQAAQLGINTPPHIVTEMEQIRAESARLSAKLTTAIPATSRSALRQVRQQALKAYYAQQWTQAEDLLAQVLASELDDTDISVKLSEVQRQLELQAFYQAICEMRNEGLWQPVLRALDDLERRQAGYPDPERLRAWAEDQRYENQNALGQASIQQSLFARLRTPIVIVFMLFVVGGVLFLSTNFNILPTPSDPTASSFVSEKQNNAPTRTPPLPTSVPTVVRNDALIVRVPYGEHPTVPDELKMVCLNPSNTIQESLTCPIIKFDGYTYWAYSYYDNRFAMAIMAFDDTGNLVRRWNKAGARYIVDITVNSSSNSVTFLGLDNQKIEMALDELKIVSK